jgi:hypothetical protein
MKKWAIALSILASMSCFSSSVAADEPGWSGRVIVFGQERAQVQATPIVHRAYRPMHFYGNTVRRRYYRGPTLPRPAATVQAATEVAE